MVEKVAFGARAGAIGTRRKTSITSLSGSAAAFAGRKQLEQVCFPRTDLVAIDSVPRVQAHFDSPGTLSFAIRAVREEEGARNQGTNPTTLDAAAGRHKLVRSGLDGEGNPSLIWPGIAIGLDTSTAPGPLVSLSRRAPGGHAPGY